VQRFSVRNRDAPEKAPGAATVKESTMLSTGDLLIRLCLAALLGSVVGAERERLLWAAGLRTHMLVCVGACLFMIVSAFGFSDIVDHYHVILDPSRVAAQVVSGIGFLGAGSILLRGEVVKGLTTAASLWTVAAIGLAVGGGLYGAAIASTAIILVILAGIKPLEEFYRARASSCELRIRAARGAMSVDILDAVLGPRARRVTRYVATPGEEPDTDEVSVRLSRIPRAEVEQIARKLRGLAGVHDVTAA
jgi:putative Mg2+ transporter-C (MgtC) family protein